MSSSHSSVSRLSTTTFESIDQFLHFLVILSQVGEIELKHTRDLSAISGSQMESIEFISLVLSSPFDT